MTVVGYGTGGGSAPQDPLVLDRTGRGIELVAQSQSAARFDALADGVRRQIGWVGATNGILVFDRNRNGVVDSSAEWFGQNFTRDGATPPAGQTGFAALATLARQGATGVFEATYKQKSIRASCRHPKNVQTAFGLELARSSY
ncbi:hypothetical protein [Methylosinus sp. RM1]|uniref:hypothetical protein n=1 Tax=Methylosinus sp. RM1 TaxID=2583817 RepID=UPI00140B464F|nr:hypothetical protein [Methylosinus sp. RM1]